ncbi:hypothetical protein [Kitasatospora cheerisanensis]|uniref:Uncharacterized protein n=1 Tax=Kitasatospora cheerisanensis KCTC 2395 TaxID=1348663 RepID=A0A066Z3M9_9ACTN|nr:hypothetical protein KCH_12950 [Kitasatospora cheerisanensis KCTC 2395]
MSGGDQFTFNAPITQSVIGGTGNVQNNYAGPAADQAPAVRELAAELARLVQQEAPALAPTADAVHGELATAEDEGRTAEPGRLRGWLGADRPRRHRRRRGRHRGRGAGARPRPVTGRPPTAARPVTAGRQSVCTSASTPSPRSRRSPSSSGTVSAAAPAAAGRRCGGRSTPGRSRW